LICRFSVFLLVDVVLLTVRQGSAGVLIVPRLVRDLAVLLLQLVLLAAADVALAILLIDLLVGILDAILDLIFAHLLRGGSAGREHEAGEGNGGDLGEGAMHVLVLLGLLAVGFTPGLMQVAGSSGVLR
jgi:hypothetical protein